MCCAFPIGLMALGCGAGLPDRQSCRWPVSEQGLTIQLWNINKVSNN